MLAKLTLAQKSICTFISQVGLSVSHPTVFSTGCTLVALESLVEALIQSHVTELLLYGYGMKAPITILGHLHDYTPPATNCPVKYDIGLTLPTTDIPLFCAIGKTTYRMFVDVNHHGSIHSTLTPPAPHLATSITVYPAIMHLLKSHLPAKPTMPLAYSSI